MSIDPLGQLQAALYSLLDGDATLDTPIYDYVPEGTTGDYVTIGEGWMTPADTHGHVAYDVAAQIDVWSWSRGFAAAQTVTARLLGLLNRSVLTVTGFTPAPVRVTGTQSMRDSNPDVRHIAVTCRALLYPT